MITKKGTAFLIKIRDGSKRRELSPEYCTKELNFQHNTIQRRALSPKIRNTYIAVNNVNLQNDRYQEQSFSNKLKLIHINLRSKESRAKKCRLEGCIKVMDKNSPNGENNTIYSMAEKSSHKVIDSPTSHHKIKSELQDDYKKGEKK